MRFNFIKLPFLAALTAFVTLPAFANDASMQLTGYYNVGFISADMPSESESESEVIVQDAEIIFTGKSLSDSGVEYGFQIQLEGAQKSSDQIDEHYAYVKGGFGKVIIGAENGAADKGAVQAPTKFVAGMKMYANNMTNEIIEDELGVDDENMSTRAEHITGDALKLTYFAPRIAGLQIGMSMTPNSNKTNGASDNAEVPSEFEDTTEFSLNYKAKRAGIKYQAAFTQLAGNAVEGALGEDASSLEDPTTTSIGLKIGMDNLEFGFNQTTYENFGGGTNEVTTLNTGISYKIGNSTYGLGYTTSTDEAANGDELDYTEMLVGGSTKLADGVKFGYFYQTAEVDGGNDVTLFGATLALKF